MFRCIGISLGIFLALSGCEQAGMENLMSFDVQKTDEEWQAALSPEQFRVLRKHGTKPAFSGKYDGHNEDGSYTCAGCGHPLFSSEHKFDSGTGWPSYFQPLAPGAVGERKDRSFGMVRTEVHCSRCGGHLGHLFTDGPQPTGLRYCINSASLNFLPAAPDSQSDI